LFVDPEMARRTLFDMGAFCHFDPLMPVSKVKIGNMQNVTVGRQMGQIGYMSILGWSGLVEDRCLAL
jgi:hypothetical protein